MTDTHEAARSDLSIDISTIDSVRIVTLRGEIDHTHRDALYRELVPSEHATEPRTVLDLSGVSFMDSSGLNVLIAAHQALTETDGRLHLVGAHGPVLRVMELVGIDTVIPCHPTVHHALND
ncbi:STAS domain-containing protein [Streptomyces sp. Tu 3180]|uniref:STAS domain-containing protein n=1 Tax=Streptomyces sp. Tu 3180 TaxID=2682611 RepID=UPI001359151E|nr:STAS domain-containing protein [Streptomyces sp. Tu 3180]KAF3469313.1 STAS domain-containing protein [Streptomyces sp. Tu 3180]